MFKKLKDKLAEEVKSSPQRIQLFAQAAQAAVTSASSSISDITNSDLFSIGDNDGQQPRPNRPPSSPPTEHKTFQDVSLMQSPPESVDFSQELGDGQRQRRLSNSSFASDVSFRLPSYETPSMYHLQSDMEVSASEADDRGFSGGGPVTLDRVTKEQLYAAYKRTQERYKKYRTQYGDLARHYKLLERENAKARSVLVETQDKALRRISELKEQCSLEQSAKAHLEKALRVEIEEKCLKIESLNTKIQFLQNNTLNDVQNDDTNANKPADNDVQLINIDNEVPKNEESTPDTSSLINKIEKMEQLLNKYKESLKTSKEKNSQMTTELQILSKELENKNKQIEDLKASEDHLKQAKAKIQELNNINEELQNQVNSYEFQRTKEQSTLELDLQKANDEIAELRGKIEVFTKREEEYAISLAENKLSIHKELESKEAEIKSLKDIVSASTKEIQSLKIVVDDYKNNISNLEDEKIKLTSECAELATLKNKIIEMDSKIQDLSKKSHSLEQLKAKADEEYKCLQLQLKQETAEKLAMIDRNAYLETKNSQLSEDNSKKNTKICSLESQLQVLNDNDKNLALKDSEKLQLTEERNIWKEKCIKLEQEIQEEREELVKLQTEIEKLLSNHELIQTQNAEFRSKIASLNSEYSKQHDEILQYKTYIKTTTNKMLSEIKQLKENVSVLSREAKATLQTNKETLSSIAGNINSGIKDSISRLLKEIDSTATNYNNLKIEHDLLQSTVASSHAETTEKSSKYEDLQKETNSLRLKLQENETEVKNIKVEIESKTYECDALVEKNKSLIEENTELGNKLKELETTLQQTQSNFESEKAQIGVAAEKLKMTEMDKQTLKDTIQSLESQNKMYCDEIDQLKQQHAIVLHEIKINHDELLRKKEDTIAKMSQDEQQQQDVLEKIQQLETEKNKLHQDLLSLEDANMKLQSEIDDLSNKHEAAISKVKDLNVEIDNKARDLEASKQNQISLEKEIAQYCMTNNIVSELENTKQSLTEKLEIMETKNKHLSVELGEIKSKLEIAESRILEINTALTKKSTESEDKQLHIVELEKQIQKLTQENITLKSETTNFASNIEKLETEIEDIKISHAEIETEKDRLNRIIEELEMKQKEKEDNKIMTINMESQTESNEEEVEHVEPEAVLENKWVKEHKHDKTLSSTASLNLKKDNLEDLYEQYSTMKMNYDSLKDENRRLQSDIEGLQSYLTKISKENSVLNDKLRELIATSEHSTDADQLSSDVKELRNEMQISKEKINDLQRENTLLIEENLELKDQLESQNYSKPVENKTTLNNKDVDVIKVKYNDLLHAHSNLEKQNMDLEQMNKSVNTNMQQLQDKNERLRLSNEKLERRLDEALVSLRHLHSLQENTELEYLRNILYEYLTGSGTHSVTLAKVLAAIVKFDDGQTQLVLQKEKERQGFLRQLGII